jgi:hypothetical protein
VNSFGVSTQSNSHRTSLLIVFALPMSGISRVLSRGLTKRQLAFFNVRLSTVLSTHVFSTIHCPFPVLG